MRPRPSTSAPRRAAAFDIYALYNKETDQVTIRGALTQDTPGIIAAKLTDPRTQRHGKVMK
jgi:hypothetical protein